MTSQRHQATDFHLVLIGAGASTLYTLINLVKRLAAGPPPPAPFRIAMVERSPDGFGGVPYSSRSSYNSLLITSLRNFLPDSERVLFMKWLDENKHWALNPFQQQLGPLSARWLATHRGAIERGDWEDLYLPRYLFGLYMDARVRQCLAAARSIGVCTLEQISGTVNGLTRTGDIFEIDVEGGPQPLRVCAANVVLAVGSPPNQVKLAQTVPIEGACLIEDPYEPNLNAALEQIEAFLSQTADPAPEVLLLGASASTMDVLYTLNDRLVDRLGVGRSNVRFRVMAPNGKLPDLLDENAPHPAYVPPALQALADRSEFTAKDIYDAAVCDIESGGSGGLTTSDMLAPISAAVYVCVKRLPLAAKQEFAAIWGNAIGRLQRRAGHEYLGVAAQLASEGRLEVIPGRFRGIASISAEGAEVEYESAGVLHRLPHRQSVIVNCAGFARIVDLPETHLLRRLLAGALAAPTFAGTGLAVNDMMECSPGLFVLGPLLAGNVISGSPIWHLEHCGRISSFSDILADTLFQRLH